MENFRNPCKALPYFTRAIELRPDSALLWTYAGICQTRLGKLQEGLQALRRAEQLGAHDAVHLEAIGDAYYHLGRFSDGRQSYEAAQAAGSHSSVLESKLGVCEVRLGSAEAGLQRIQNAIKREPEFGELYDILVAAALFTGNRALAAETAVHRLGMGTPSADGFLLAAGIYAQLGEWQRAAQILKAGRECFPENAKLHSASAEVNEKLGPKQ